MKKIALTFLACLSTFAFADKTPTAQTEKTARPENMLYLSVYQKTPQNDLSKDLQKQKISRKAKNEQICWVATGKFGPKVKTVELFKSPAPTSFSSPDAITKASQDKRHHTIERIISSFQKGELVVNCWTFNQQDPVGQYTLQVNIDDVYFPAVTFEVTK